MTWTVFADWRFGLEMVLDIAPLDWQSWPPANWKQGRYQVPVPLIDRPQVRTVYAWLAGVARALFGEYGLDGLDLARA